MYSMENEEIVNQKEQPVAQSNNTKIIKISFFLFLILIVFYYLFLSVLAPIKAYKEIHKKYLLEDTILASLICNDSVADSLALANALITSRITAASLDSINFVLNLKDSVLDLQIEGVSIHQVKILKMKYSKIFDNFNSDIKYSYLASPFYITDYNSTIVKVPIVVKHAPRDTAEAAQMNAAPKLPPEDYVHYEFHFDKDLVLTVNQSDPPAKHNRLKAFYSYLDNKFSYVINILKSAVKFKSPAYIPWIEIEIPGEDAKTVFRALPENAAMVLILK